MARASGDRVTSCVVAEEELRYIMTTYTIKCVPVRKNLCCTNSGQVAQVKIKKELETHIR